MNLWQQTGEHEIREIAGSQWAVPVMRPLELSSEEQAAIEDPYNLPAPSVRLKSYIRLMEDAPETMTQEAPYPETLASLVSRLEYRDGWNFALRHTDRGQGSAGLTFEVYGRYPDTYHPERQINVVHYFIVPAAAYDERSWRRWIFERLLEVERHEAAEFFKIDGERPYAPHHGPGNDPYIIFEHGTDEDVRTSFRGETKPAS